MRCRCAVTPLRGGGMKSWTSPTPSGIRNRVIRTLVSGVELLGAPPVGVGRDTEQPPVVGVEDSREDARRVEARTAIPVDRAVGANERDRVQVADQAVFRDRQIAHPWCRSRSNGHGSRGSACVDVERHRVRSSPAYGTRTSLPFDAELSSSSCARRASDSGRRSATIGWILCSRSNSSSAWKSSANQS